MSKRILVIDDETNVRTMIRLTLEHAGYEVSACDNGEDGIALVRTGQVYDLILVDYRLPGKNGHEVQQEIHALRPEVPVIIITAFGTIDLAMDAIHSGATDFLRKPFSADVLRETVKAALGAPRRAGDSVPIEKVCRPFARININGFSFQPDEDAAHNDVSDGIEAHFKVHKGEAEHHAVTVLLEGYVTELAKAHLDIEEVPGGDSFWHAMCEEALADYLWQNSAVPPDEELIVQDLSPSLEKWLDSVSTVQTYG